MPDWQNMGWQLYSILSSPNQFLQWSLMVLDVNELIVGAIDTLRPSFVQCSLGIQASLLQCFTNVQTVI